MAIIKTSNGSKDYMCKTYMATELKNDNANIMLASKRCIQVLTVQRIYDYLMCFLKLRNIVFWTLEGHDGNSQAIAARTSAHV